ncbi:thiolase-like protein [Gonapodya prolifera JEL478]|uniref:Thiolase-like protein n=1 Tax=Gonapodya prolifera (strain JEL478) TaxID=1344416 RepID=A0A139AZV5_GONPJ|nr:thiolase-like protein [Gonapodya prolifera JEL478]|eukprot:KXS22005.1 thiolase-like protein [Gonapodya prolifera JEL478]
MSCRYPNDIATPQEYWNTLSAAKDIRTGPPNERWGTSIPLSQPLRGTFLHDIEQYDPEYFGLAEDEVKDMDAQQRIAIEVCCDALRSASYWDDENRRPKEGKDNIATYVGVANPDGATLGYQTEPTKNTLVGVLTFGASNRAAYCLGLKGGSMTLDTGCSSSLYAVHMACNSLLMGDCDAALACGSTVITNPNMYTMLYRVGVLSPNYMIRAFDAAADGYVRGEGCGAVLLKRLADAERDGDVILGVIRGSAIGHNGKTRNIVAPSVEGQGRVINEAMERAGVTAAQVDYVEAHATGTKAGDRKELLTIQEVYVDKAKERTAERPVVVGAVKSMFGHAEGAAGIMGLQKAILVLLNRSAPPNINFTRIRPEVAIDYGSKVVFPLGENMNLGDREGLLWAGVNSFGAGGTNAHVVIQEYPRQSGKEVKFEKYSYNKRFVPVVSHAGEYFICEHIRSMCETDPVLARAPAAPNGHLTNGHAPAAAEKGRVGKEGTKNTKSDGEVYFLPAAFGCMLVGSLATVAWKVFRG